jgi:hypothetical protein
MIGGFCPGKQRKNVSDIGEEDEKFLYTHELQENAMRLTVWFLELKVKSHCPNSPGPHF